MKNKTRVIVAGVAAGVITISVVAGVIAYKYSQPKPVQSASTQEFLKSNYRMYWWGNKKDLMDNYQAALSNAVAVAKDKLYTGHKVYLDADNKPFIISGDSVMYLSVDLPDQLRPIDKINIREEFTGTKLRIFRYQSEVDGWKKLSSVDGGNVTINEYKTIKVALESDEKNSYVEALPIFDETGVTYTRDSKSLTLTYKPIAGNEMKFIIPIGTKGTDFTDMNTKSICKVAFVQDTKLMVDTQVLQQLLGFEATVDDIGGEKTLSVISDYANIQVPVVWSKNVTIDLTQFYKKKSDGTFDTVITTAANTTKENTASGSPNPGSSSKPVESASSAPSKTTAATQKSNGSGSKAKTNVTKPSAAATVTKPSESYDPDAGKTGKTHSNVSADGSTTDVWRDGDLIHQIQHTCVGDVDIVSAQGDGREAARLVGAAFKKAHPEWEVSESSGGCHYVGPPYDYTSTLEDVEEFCNGDPKSIRKMSRSQLYELASIVEEMGGLDVIPYKDAFLNAWKGKMTWTFAHTNEGVTTVNGE